MMKWTTKKGPAENLFGRFVDINYLAFKIVLGFISCDAHEFLSNTTQFVNLGNNFINFICNYSGQMII